MILARKARAQVLGGLLATFVAGALFGLALPRATEALAGAEPETADAFYVRELTDRYGLDRRQVELVRMILASRTADYLKVLLADQGRLPQDLRQQVSDADRRAQERIKFVLTEEQRRTFLRDSLPREFAPADVGPDDRATRR
ncbi:MAG: hypothetical protein HZB39_19690 [Planctomycetes bacterium]|nr:hypothetical protein [Planctomycetota bacterium]